jgi:hypothetical protein
MAPHAAFELGVRWVFFHVCFVIATSSLLANFLPDIRYFRNHPRFQLVYSFFVDYVALFALNFRTNLPSLDQEFMGFRRRLRHAYRNWRQRTADRAAAAPSVKG